MSTTGTSSLLKENKSRKNVTCAEISEQKARLQYVSTPQITIHAVKSALELNFFNV